MRETAVEWIIDQLFELRNPTLNQIEIVKKAREMEKQQERMYSEEDMRKAFIAGFTPKLTTTLNDSFNKWFEQFNKNT